MTSRRLLRERLEGAQRPPSNCADIPATDHHVTFQYLPWRAPVLANGDRPSSSEVLTMNEPLPLGAASVDDESSGHADEVPDLNGVGEPGERDPRPDLGLRALR